jgi:hypothetical protein
MVREITYDIIKVNMIRQTEAEYAGSHMIIPINATEPRMNAVINIPTPNSAP